MSDIADLMASNDPMVTPVMSLGPAPPTNTSPQLGQPDTTSIMHEKQIEQMSPLSQVLPDRKVTKSKLTTEQRVSIVVAICAFIVLLPNVQQLLTQQLPVLSSNSTLLVVSNSALIAGLFFVMRDHIIDLV
tara:strand:+ start:573 stop:965 length:393 start_codon:yes stop_codon:yes gene_type:complete